MNERTDVYVCGCCVNNSARSDPLLDERGSSERASECLRLSLSHWLTFSGADESRYFG